MYALLTQTDVGLTAVAFMGAIASRVWPYVMMFFGFSLIIFVHEFGHFIVAKLAGVRVEQFAIGFGREIWGFSKGETRYSFNILPLGGYVKMLGQEDFDDKSNELKFKDDPRSFVNKPISHRMAIVSAGVVMNVLFACFLFMIVFMIGMDAMGTRIAWVSPDGPADKAGLLPGDDVKEINGSAIREFNEVSMAIMLAAPFEPIDFVVERDGTRKHLSVTPQTDDEQGQLMISIAPGRTREIVILGPDMDTNSPDAPHVGDVLVEIDGQPVTDDNINEMRQRLAYATGGVYVERKDPDNPDAPPSRILVKIPPILQLHHSDPLDDKSINLLGLTPLVRLSSVDPTGRGATAGLDVGDTILSFNDILYPTPRQIARAVRDNAEWDVEFTVKKSDGRRFQGFVRPKAGKKRGGTTNALCEPIPGTRQSDNVPCSWFTVVDQGGAAFEAGIREGDVVIECAGVENPTRKQVSKSIAGNLGRRVSIAVQKTDGSTVRTHVVPRARGSLKVGFGLLAQDLLRVGTVAKTLNGQPSPAAKAGIPAGALIVSVDGAKVTRWRELVDEFRSRAGSTVQLAYLDDDNMLRTVPFVVPSSLRTLLDLGPEARVLTIDGKETIRLDLNRGPEYVSVGYHEGTKAVLRELVGQTQVPVEYRDNLLGEVKTAHVDVTEDMVDPWLSRVKLKANVEVDIEYKPLKGENALDAVVIGVHKTYYFIVQVYEVINRMIFSRSVGVENLSGPLGIVSIGGKMAEKGFVDFLFFMAIISANLAVLNFLPLPIVDGGLMVFLIIEKIKGSPVSLRVQVATQMIGLFLLIGAFIYVTFNDVLKLVG